MKVWVFEDNPVEKGREITSKPAQCLGVCICVCSAFGHIVALSESWCSR